MVGSLVFENTPTMLLRPSGQFLAPEPDAAAGEDSSPAQIHAPEPDAVAGEVRSPGQFLAPEEEVCSCCRDSEGITAPNESMSESMQERQVTCHNKCDSCVMPCARAHIWPGWEEHRCSTHDMPYQRGGERAEQKENRFRREEGRSMGARSLADLRQSGPRPTCRWALFRGV